MLKTFPTMKEEMIYPLYVPQDGPMLTVLHRYMNVRLLLGPSH